MIQKENKRENRIDLKNFGLRKEERNELINEYRMKTAKRKVYMIAYMILPGIEVYYTDYQTEEHFCGKIDQCSYYQIAYSHKGVYESKIDGNRSIKLSEGEISMTADVFQSFDSYMPMGYYKGINIVFYPQMIKSETVDFLQLFSIDLDKMFQTYLCEKNYERFSCNSSIRREFEALYAASKAGDHIHMKMQILRILTEFAHFDGIREKKYRAVTPKKTQSMIEIRNYMERNMQKHITIKELAIRFRLSETSLKENFKLMYGCSPHAFLKKCRMEWSAQRLRKSSESVAEIGNAAGYENPSKFSAAFTSVYGVTPMQYRKKV